MTDAFLDLSWPVQVIVVLCLFGIVRALIVLVKYAMYVLGSVHENRCRVKVARCGKEADWK